MLDTEIGYLTGKRVDVHWLGRVSYAYALGLQESRRSGLLAGTGVGAVFLAEHFPVITLGRSAAETDILLSSDELRDRGIWVERSTRGGLATFHGPGQLMVYPVVRIRSVLAFLESVALALAKTLARVGLPDARWQREPAGLWIGSKKVAACGIHVHRGVTTHGFALNVATPAEAWTWVRPCGMTSAAITSVANELNRTVAVPDLAALAATELVDAITRE